MMLTRCKWRISKVTATNQQITIEMRTGSKTLVQDLHPSEMEGHTGTIFTDEQVKAILDQNPIGKAVDQISMDQASYDELVGFMKELDELRNSKVKQPS